MSAATLDARVRDVVNATCQHGTGWSEHIISRGQRTDQCGMVASLELVRSSSRVEVLWVVVTGRGMGLMRVASRSVEKRVACGSLICSRESSYRSNGPERIWKDEEAKRSQRTCGDIGKGAGKLKKATVDMEEDDEGNNFGWRLAARGGSV
ncbi:hypothetical protein PIB30_051909 [Stylosanthes scabra]|uniref:Uncharacterized protein n=1 Tax=Stylosanthes scabra TaxID=79078 RepID=A0ABU6ZGR9_9FABA|nr:hypothetical protein [Stylosanthes scabra]